MAEAILVAGLGFGDEGKGATVDYLCRAKPTQLVVRYNGGAQAAHNVVDPRFGHHTFAQYGSGTFSGVPTYLSRFMMVNPAFLANETRHLRLLGLNPDPPMVDEAALITTRVHIWTNRVKELSRTSPHGSCGMGIGETMSGWLSHPESALVAKDLKDPYVVARKLTQLHERMRTECRNLSAYDVFLEEPTAVREHAAELIACGKELQIRDDAWLRKTLQSNDRVVFEGAQGVLLDQDYGFHPHTTWSKTTFENAETLLAGFSGTVSRVGVLRTYHTRHGAGPLVTELPAFDAWSRDDHNRQGEWQGRFRSGSLDLVLGRYAVDVCGGVDSVAITHVDRLPETGISYCDHYRSPMGLEFRSLSQPSSLAQQARLTEELQSVQPFWGRAASTEQYLEIIESRLTAPITLLSTGATANDRSVRRNTYM